MEILFDNRPITDTLRNALATGNWGKSMTGEVIKSGVAQVLKRDTSFFATLSHLRRVVAPIQASSKSAKPRLLHNTHFFSERIYSIIHLGMITEKFRRKRINLMSNILRLRINVVKIVNV